MAATTRVYPAVPLPDAPLVPLAPNASLQPPLSRRGYGPGIVIIDPGYDLPALPSAETLDPPPQYKWAEEGYAVVRLAIRADGGKDEDDWDVRAGLGRAIEALRGLDQCDVKDKTALLVYGTTQQYPPGFPEQLTAALAGAPSIVACVAFSSAWRLSSPSRAQLVHEPGRRGPRPAAPGTTTTTTTTTKVYAYPAASSSEFVVPVPGGRDYVPGAASLAHSRSLGFVKGRLGGPLFDLEEIWEEHTRYEFGDRSVEKTMGTMVLEPYVNHVPTLTGGIGRERLTDFYRHHFILNNPDDTALELVSRTVGVDRIVDEFVYSFTHDMEIDWLLPGVPPTGLPVRIPFVAVVNVRGDRLCHEHISWDQATTLRQLGLLPEYLPFPHPVAGREGQILEYRVPAAGVETALKLADERCVGSNGLFVAAGEGVREVGAKGREG